LYQYEAVGTKLIIGKFCSIAAEAVVVRDVEPYTIAGGNPARHQARTSGRAYYVGAGALIFGNWYDILCRTARSIMGVHHQ